MIAYRYIGPSVPPGTHQARMLFSIGFYRGEELLGVTVYIEGVPDGD